MAGTCHQNGRQQNPQTNSFRSTHRRRGRPLLRYKDILRRDLLEADIDPDTYAELATNRPGWRMSVHSGIAASEERLRTKAEERRLERKRKEAIRHTLDAPSLSVFPCPHCQTVFKNQRGLYNHLRTHHRNSVSWCS